MKKLLFIFVIAFQGCEKMTVSEALPIQFWPISGQTFNEKVNAYVDKQCFTQEFDCNDNVKLQVLDDIFGNNYNLKIIDENGATIQNIAFSKPTIPFVELLNSTFQGSSNPWVQFRVSTDINDDDRDWIWIANSQLKCDANYTIIGDPTVFNNSKFLGQYKATGFDPNTYSFSIIYKNTSGENSIIKILGSNDGTSFTEIKSITSNNHASNSFSISTTFTTSTSFKYLGVRVIKVSGKVNFEISSLKIGRYYSAGVGIGLPATQIQNNENNLSFSAISLPTSICDAFVRFIIQQNGVDVLKSDYIKFNSSISFNQGHGSFLIAYKSAKNFAGISYPNDGSYFYLRIPARFFQQRNNSKQSSLELSNSKVINTSVILKLQQLMVTTLLPDYMHNKLQLALSHGVRGSLLIDGLEWTLEENYERNSPDAKSPFQFGKVWLTRKNHLVRNII